MSPSDIELSPLVGRYAERKPNRSRFSSRIAFEPVRFARASNRDQSDAADDHIDIHHEARRPGGGPQNTRQDYIDDNLAAISA